MDSDLPSKIDALKRQQSRIQDELHRLSEQCKTMSQDLRSLSLTELKKEAPAPKPDHSPSSPATLAQAIDFGRSQVESTTPPPPPLPTPTATSISPSTPSGSKPKASEDISESSADVLFKKPTTPEKSNAGQKPMMNAGEWELNFGQVWLVRIGVVFLLTGLIFLSTYAYKNWLFHSGPGVKVAFFMVISMALTGTGLWLEKWKDRFKQYGRVVAAGGLAAGYYTIYASHFTPALKLISSPVLAGLLLTIWAAAMLGYAVWKKSRIVAVMAIGLAFYGTVINPAGWLSLFSSLLLSSAGMWLLVRFRWVGIGLGTVIAAYVAHAFWLGYYPTQVAESLRLSYLACYWLLFTAALAVPQARTLDLKIQRSICAINNASAWTLTVFLIPSFIPHPEIGWISIGIGALWILIAAAIRYNQGDRGFHPSLSIIFGYQGLLIVSLGILLEATGYTRFLVMAVEACVLLAGARYFGGKLARIASVLAFACALLTALPMTLSMGNPTFTQGWASYAALALVGAAYTILMCRDERQSHAFGNLITLIPPAATWVILVWGVFGQWPEGVGLNGLWLTTTAVMLTYFLMNRPWWLANLAIPSIFVALGGGWWFLQSVDSLSTLQSLCPIICMAVFWFMAPRLTRAADELMGDPAKTTNPLLEWVFSFLLCFMLFLFINQHFSHSQWLVTGGLLAIAANAAAHFTQRRSIGIPALLFHGMAIIQLLDLWRVDPYLSLMPSVLILSHLALVDTIWPVLGKKGMRIFLSLLLLVSLLVALSVMELSRPDLLLTAVGLGLMAWAYVRNDRAFAAAGGTPTLIIACLISISIHPAQDWGRYLPIILTMCAHGFLWLRKSEPDVWLKQRALLLSVALVSLFIASSLHVRASFDGSGLSICWALIAMLLFGMGLLLRCRPYRLVGLFWLAAAVVHVVAVDVMRLGSLGRILSFMTLGVVLLILGFLYNRFQETIRKFL